MFGYGNSYKRILQRISNDTYDPDALAFIARHNQLSGATMDTVQQNAVFQFFNEIKGVGTPNGSNLATKLLTDPNARVFLYCPVNDSTANFAAYALSINLAEGTFVNMVSGDLSVNGVKGGTGKYLNMGVSPNAFTSSSMCFGVYSRTNLSANAKVDIGARDGVSLNIASLNISNGSNQLQSAANQSSFNSTANANSLGLWTINRNNGATYDVNHNNSLFTTISTSAGIASSNNMYMHARNDFGTVGGESSRQLCGGFISRGLSNDQLEDLLTALNNFNTNCITGGRNTY